MTVWHPIQDVPLCLCPESPGIEDRFPATLHRISVTENTWMEYDHVDETFEGKKLLLFTAMFAEMMTFRVV